MRSRYMRARRWQVRVPEPKARWMSAIVASSSRKGAWAATWGAGLWRRVETVVTMLRTRAAVRVARALMRCNASSSMGDRADQPGGHRLARGALGLNRAIPMAGWAHFVLHRLSLEGALPPERAIRSTTDDNARAT